MKKSFKFRIVEGCVDFEAEGYTYEEVCDLMTKVQCRLIELTNLKRNKL